ncbi:MAG: PD-(D/E)XK nuclease family protein, partial [Gammaproteobacteria bacterium]
HEFGALWLCGLTADRWPAPARPHALIPLVLQQAAGMPEATPAATEAQTRRRFEQLLASADHLVLSWPVAQDDAETLPSPLLKSPLLADAQVVTATAEDIALHPDRQCVADSGTAEDVASDPPPALPAGRRLKGGARVLAMQAVCPARAYVEFRLGGRPLDPPARPLDAATRGKLLHALLERLYALEPCTGGLGAIAPEALRKLFEPVIGRVLDEFLPAVDPYLASLRPLEADRLWALLLSLKALDQDRQPFTVETELAREVSIGSLALHVRLDRVDRLEAGGELVIDYKSGKFDVAGWKRPRITDSQLPLYAVTGGYRGVAVIQLRPPAAELRGVGDPALGIPGMKSPAEFFREGGLDWQGTLGRWRTQLECLAAELAAGDFRVNPDDRRWAIDQFAPITRIHDALTLGEVDEPAEGDAA